MTTLDKVMKRDKVTRALKMIDQYIKKTGRFALMSIFVSLVQKCYCLFWQARGFSDSVLPNFATLSNFSTFNARLKIVTNRYLRTNPTYRYRTCVLMLICRSFRIKFGEVPKFGKGGGAAPGAN